MSKWAHAINEKVIINLDHAGARHVYCAWDTCENDGYELYKIRINYGTTETPHVVTHVFCCERHKQYWVYASQRDCVYGKLPPGSKRSYI